MNGPKIKNQRGLSLIEVLVSLAIITMTMMVAVNTLSNRGRKLKREIYKFSLVAKKIQSKAKLFNTTYRLAINLGTDDDNEQAFWVERSTKSGLVLEGESPIAQRIAAIAEGKSEEELGKLPPTAFNVDPKVFKKVQKFDEEIRITEIESLKKDKAIVDGIAYIYFLPQGLIDPVAIHFETESKEKQWTVTFHPLTAAPKVTGKYIALKDLYDQ